MTNSINADTTLQVNNLNNYTTFKLSNEKFNSDSNMKLQRPLVNVVEAPTNLITQNKFSYTEAKKQLDKINNDIYVGTKNEKSKHSFDFKKYFTILGIIGIIATAIAYFRKK